jgi:hypothetical protein
MAKKSAPTCKFKGCKNPCRSGGINKWGRFCPSHGRKATINAFLFNVYSGMNCRVRGKSTKRPDLYKGLPLLPKDVFMNWAKNHPDFLAMYKRWFTSDFNRKLTPTINRMNSSKGYVLGNIEWLTNSQNCGLSSGVRSMKAKKIVYEILGVDT